MSVNNNEERKLQHLCYSNASITSVWTQAPFLVFIIASSGTAPQFAISSALTGARIILFSLEDEREVAELSFGIPTDNSCICLWSQKISEDQQTLTPSDAFVCSLPRYTPLLGQKPYFLSWSKLFVVAHQRYPSERPSEVQLSYSLPKNVKGNTHFSPLAFPPNV